jgi:hypothetical protein
MKSSAANNAIKEAKAKGNDVIIIDTAGRLAIDEQMMDEISNLKNAVNPDETLFVVDSMTGQDAVNTAKEFNDRLNFDGVVLTKLDGDTRGGAALSIRTVVTKPIKFGLFSPDRLRALAISDNCCLVSSDSFLPKLPWLILAFVSSECGPFFLPRSFSACLAQASGGLALPFLF